MDRPVTDERLDQAIQGYLVERIDEIASGGVGTRMVTERIVARLPSSSTGTSGRWTALIAAGLVLAALAGVTLVAGAQQTRRSPIPDRPAVCESMWPGFMLLSSDAAGVSIQVPSGWGRSTSSPRGFTKIMEGGTGNVGLGVLLPPGTASDVEAAAIAVMDDPELAEWQPYVRTDFMHGTHRAVRLESRTPPLGYVGGRILYIVERRGSRPVVVDLAWDSVANLGYVEEAILRSLNLDGHGPAVLVSYPAGSSSWVTKTESGCSVAW